MRMLLSTIGSRGDVQPLVAMASQVKVLGQEVRLCIPPDFRDSIEAPGDARHAHPTGVALDRETQVGISLRLFQQAG
jgi:UDP:flavonoid glycosyltransferase YjiC (YdhE family)